MRNIFSFISLSVCLFACNKDAIDKLNKLSPITVNVVQRSPNSAIIEWTSSESAMEQAQYDIVLAGIVIKTNLSATIDTIMNLRQDSIYHGRVIAHTSSGDTTSAPFTLEKVDGYILFGNYQNHSLFSCYNIYSGSKMWSTSYSGNFYFDNIPTIVNDTVYANSSGSGTWALSLKTGEKFWNNPLGGMLVPLYYNGVIYSVGASNIAAINAKTGNTIWSSEYEANYSLYKNPVIAGNYLITGTQGTLIAVNIADGTKVWEYRFNSKEGTLSHPVVYKNLLISGCSDGKIYAFNNQTGELVWTKNLSRIDNNYGTDVMSPIIYNDKLITHSGNSGYYSLNPLTGETLWNYPDAYNTVSSPAAGGGLIYFTKNYTTAIALNASTGTVEWERNNVPSVTPIFIKSRLYFGSIVLEASSGKRLLTLASNEYGSATSAIVENGVSYYPAESGMVQ